MTLLQAKGKAWKSLLVQRGVPISELDSTGKIRTIPIIFGSQTLNVSGFRFTSYIFSSPRSASNLTLFS